MVERQATLPRTAQSFHGWSRSGNFAGGLQSRPVAQTTSPREKKGTHLFFFPNPPFPPTTIFLVPCPAAHLFGWSTPQLSRDSHRLTNPSCFVQAVAIFDLGLPCHFLFFSASFFHHPSGWPYVPSGFLLSFTLFPFFVCIYNRLR